MTTPVEATSFELTPVVFKEHDDAPKFTIRYGTRRDKMNWRELMAREGLQHHDMQEIRTTIKDSIGSFYNSDDTPALIDAVERYWEAHDMLSNDIAAWATQVQEILAGMTDAEKEGDVSDKLPPEPKLGFDDAERLHVEGLLNAVKRDALIVRDMIADNAKADREIPGYALRILIEDFTGINKIERKNKIATDGAIDAIYAALAKYAVGKGMDQTAADTALSEATLAAMRTWSLDKDEEKNSDAPPSPISGLSSSTEADAKPSTKSTALAQSETPSNSAILETQN